MSVSVGTKDKRARLWTFVVYPSEGNPPAPENWRELLDNTGAPWVESPLHDRDENPDGSKKRAHHHILLKFDGKKSFAQVQEITGMLNAPVPQVCASAQGLVRYMAHLDNPEKVQYSIDGIIGHNGASVAELLKASLDRYALIGEMMDFVVEHEVMEISDLMMYARLNRFNDWFILLCDNSTFVLDSFIRSVRGKALGRKEVK